MSGAELLVESDFCQPGDMVVAVESLYLPSKLSSVGVDDFEWETWNGYVPFSNQAIDFGKKCNELNFRFPLEIEASEGQSIWASATLNIATRNMFFGFRFLADEETMFGRNEKSLMFHYYPRNRILRAELDYTNHPEGLPIKRKGQYLIIARYDFLSPEKTLFQYAVIPAGNPIDLQHEFSFDSPIEGVYMGTLQTEKALTRFFGTSLSLGAGNTLGNLRIGTEYQDVIGSPRKKIITFEPLAKVNAGVEVPLKYHIPTYLYVLSGVGISYLFAILGFILYGICRGRQLPKKDIAADEPLESASINNRSLDVLAQLKDFGK